MGRAFAFAVALSCAATFVASRVARAQVPPRPDSAATDSARADTTVIHHGHEMQLAFYALVLAPAGLVSFAEDSAIAGDSLPLARDHLSITIGAGLASGSNGPMGDPNFSQAVHLELFRGGRVLALRGERYLHPDRHVDYVTIRIGDALRPRARATGGVTIGFRFVPQLRRHQGVEIAFPFIGGGRRWRVRLESAYVISLQQASASYQARYERRIGTGPWMIGLNLDLEDWDVRKHGRLSHHSVGVVLSRASIW